jgi:uncharacterized membrane protein (UPF0127 family)
MIWFLLAAIIELGGMSLNVEVADTPTLRQRGLSGRAELSDGTGMLFVYEKPQIATFWMKGVTIPLSVGFFDSDQTLIQWIDMVAVGSSPYPKYKSHSPVLYALEVPMGWFRTNKIRPGMQFHWTQKSSLPDQ